MTDHLNKPAAVALRRFFMGRFYPIVVCAIVFLGHALGLELYLNVINVLLTVLMLCVCDSLHPFIVVVSSYLYQISVAHSPSVPAQSDYLITPPGVYVSSALFVLAGAALVFFFIRNRLITRGSLCALPMTFACAALSFAFVMNGVFGGSWTPSSLGYGLLNIVSFFGVFYIFYLGLRREETAALVRYLAYVSALIATVLVLEVIWLYLFGGVFDASGEVVKDKMLFGWGNWNSMGQNIVVLIPVIFYGAMNNRYPWFYFAVATLATGAAVLTLSRNALIFALLSYVACVIIACFFGKRQRAFRIIAPTGAFLVGCGIALFWDKISTILSDLISRGFSDNGRFDLYKQGIEEFLSAPIFGKGFFGITTETFNFVDFFPQMMHNTPVQLLASMGAVGLLCYLYYRYITVKLVLTRPSLEKTMLALSALVLVLQSLLDNFIFYVQPVIYYSIALAICSKPSEAELAG